MPHPAIRNIATALLVAAALCALPTAEARDADPDKCRGGALPAGTGKDLLVTGACTVGTGTYEYGNVNIYGGGSLTFAADAKVDFWASSILIENQGSLIAGTTLEPVGKSGGRLTIHLYGKDQGAGVGPAGGQGITCVMDARCGIPQDTWDSGDTEKKVPIQPGMPDDYFYAYGALPFDGGGTAPGYFGYKVLGVSFGGTLQLFGKKGATYADIASSNSGTSWVRLNKSVKAGESVIVLDRPVDWDKEDEIVLTTTDYLPAHSEQLRIKDISADRKTITVYETFAHDHRGTKYDLSNVGITLGFKDAETRAAVALLTRSIRIVSEGDAMAKPLATDSFFGGHTIVRQGVAKFQMQGVEFKQLGQGGRIAHYPVHFHMVRAAPPGTFVKDSSVNESMTRFMVIHGTQNVTFARNVGWKSIGHGFYIEDGTEYDNRFLTNIGIFARAAIDNPDNPRKVPGILAAARDPGYPENVPFYSDYDHPAVFWIMNGWNDFEYNMAAGAGTCGACYWLVPGANSGHSRHLKWVSYGSMQAPPEIGNPLNKASTTPLKRFVGNSCTSAMNSFNTIGNTTACFGVGVGAQATIPVVPNPLAPPWCDQTNPLAPPDKGGKPLPIACVNHKHGDDGNKYDVNADEYYPKVDKGGGRFPTRCGPDEDCANTPRCNGPDQLDRCMMTTLESYTSSFHWAETNFGAIWLRPQWYLMTDSVLTDVQNGGMTIVTGGGYTDSDLIKGHWALMRNSALIGSTQPDNPLASAVGPFNPRGLSCDNAAPGNYCLSAKEGVSFPISNFGIGQRLFNIYDGPAYQENNAYLAIKKTILEDCQPGGASCPTSRYMVANVLGVPQLNNQCYAPNAAIGWKQPNGFYYPPAFHSHSLFFADVDIRHFVIEPLFETDPAKRKDNLNYQTDAAAVLKAYCKSAPDMFNSFTDVDRQTELSDDDGSLTGYIKTVSVNSDPFFNAPVEQLECASDGSAKTSPYDYVTSVVYPGCAVDGSCGNNDKAIPRWDSDCTAGQCYGVPLYRQLLTKPEFAKSKSGVPIRMAGQDTFQRSTLTPNNAAYYIDTTVGLATQVKSSAFVNVFGAGNTYYTFMLFANAKTSQTYQIYVGKHVDGKKDFDPNVDVWATQANISKKPVTFPKLGSWPSGWGRSFDPATGVLTVTMSMGFPEFATNLEKARTSTCGPANFCAWKGKDGDPSAPEACRCNLNKDDPLYGACSATNSLGLDACSWSNKSLACPDGGCYGIGFKLAEGFATDPGTDPRPPAACFPKEAAGTGWNIEFKPADAKTAGACFNSPISAAQFCQ